MTDATHSIRQVIVNADNLLDAARSSSPPTSMLKRLAHCVVAASTSFLVGRPACARSRNSSH